MPPCRKLTMATEIDIINMGLDHIGQMTITSLSEQSKAAKVAKRLYPTARDQVLEDYPWNFANKRVELASITVTDMHEFEYAYQYPPDCLRALSILKVDPSLAPINFSVRINDNSGKYIACNEPAPVLSYTARITNTDFFSASFTAALSWRIAADFAMPLTRSTALQKEIYQVYLMYIKQAAQADAHEMQQPAPSQFTSFLKARA